MPSARDARTQSRTARPDSPFGAPNPDEVFEILIPEGAATGKIPASDQYIGKLLNVEHKEAKSSGNPMWVFTFTISEDEYAGMDFQIYCPLTPNALWKLADTLAALGVKFTAGEQVRFKAKDVLGVGVRMKIVDDKNQDGTRDISRLAAVLPHPEGAGFRDGKAAAGFPGKKVTDEDEEVEAQRGRKATRRPLPDDEEEDERPVRRGRARDEEEDPEEEERPRRRASAKDEEEWDEPPAAPSKRARRAEPDEEEEEDEPARNGRGARGSATRRSRI